MANYIKDLRKWIGHRPILMCGAGVLIINDKNQVLLQHRTDNDAWGIPGGALELGETIEETAKREVFEETGLTVHNLRLFGVYSGEALHHIYPNEDEVYIVANVFITNAFEGEVILDEVETKEVKFFDIEDFPRAINPPDQPILKDFKRRIKEVI
jgi:mutator protein MutT